ncbi:MAG: ATP-binding protein, partial [Usitatibacteraceae bacterium]
LTVSASDWWNDVLARHDGEGLSFTGRGDLTVPIPVNLFDTVLENCLENIRKKQRDEPDIRGVVELTNDEILELSITDTGSPVPAVIAAGLFRAPVARARGGGLGIGLYQAFKQAEQAGYVLALRVNGVAEVRFVLRAS